MSSSNSNTTSQRNTGFRAVIPFYILYDLDLNANHLILYGQIEQMESNPDPKVSPTFSYAWMAEQLKIDRRNVIPVANKLKEKGYIQHIQIEKPNKNNNWKGKWLWKTSKASIVQTFSKNDSDDSCEPSESFEQSEQPEDLSENLLEVGSDAGDHYPSDVQHHYPSDPQHHPKILEIKSQNNNKKPIVDSCESTEQEVILKNHKEEVDELGSETADKKVSEPKQAGATRCSPKAKKEYEDDKLFMEFYSQYPLKEKPTVAYQKFLELSPTPEFVKFMVDDVKKRVKGNWRGRDKSKYPHPATYINQKQWKGEIYCASSATEQRDMDRIDAKNKERQGVIL